MTDLTRLRDQANLALTAQIVCDVEPYDLLALLDENDRLRKALRGLADAAESYSPRDEHDWRCEYRTDLAGWREGEPPVIRCECGRDELDATIAAARAALESSGGEPDGR